MRIALVGGAIGLFLGLAVSAAYARGSPLAGGIERTDTWSLVFLIAVATAFVLYVTALLLLRRTEPVRLVCAFVLVIQLVPLAGPLLLSRDAYSYWAYGRIVWVHHADPYEQTPAAFPTDPATRATAKRWRRETSVYGPAFTGLSTAIAAVAGSSRDAAAYLFRAVAALAVVATAFLAASVARRKALAAALVGWNPLFAVHFAGGGHNDALMVLGMVGALALTKQGRAAAGGALWIVASAVKAAALVFLPLVLLRARRAFWAGAVVAGIVVTLLASLVFHDAWWSNFNGLSRREAGFSIPARLAQLGLSEGAGTWLLRGVLVVGGVWLVVQAVRGRPRLGLAAGLLLATSTWILPWYALWPVGLAAAEDDAVARFVGVALAGYLVADRVPF